MELCLKEGFESVLVFIDNTSAVHVAVNRAFSPRVKYIILWFFFMEELVKEGTITVQYVKTEHHLADLGTKHVHKHPHCYLIKAINEFKA